eukprot:1800431-Pleurochrysis_carterae.AAC.5
MASSQPPLSHMSMMDPAAHHNKRRTTASGNSLVESAAELNRSAVFLCCPRTSAPHSLEV